MANNDLIAIVTYEDGTQNTMRASEVDLQEYGHAIQDIILKDPDSGIINIDNGEQVEYGEPRGIGQWICVQGLWMYYSNLMDNNAIQSERNIYGDNSWNKKERIYSKFSLPENSILSGSGSVDMAGQYNLAVTLSGNNKYCDLYQNNDITGWTGFISHQCKYSGSGFGDINVERFGIYFNVIEYTDISTEEYPYGYVKAIPRWVGYDSSGQTPVGTAARTSRTGSYYAYFPMSSGGSSADFPTGTSFKDGFRSYVPLFGNAGLYIKIPFKNENERNYATGVTHTYRKMSKQKFEDYIKN